MNFRKNRELRKKLRNSESLSRSRRSANDQDARIARLESLVQSVVMKKDREIDDFKDIGLIMTVFIILSKLYIVC